MVAELRATDAGTLTLRGPMVPRYSFPPGAERSSLPCLRTDATGAVDTGYACRTDSRGETVLIVAPPPGIVCVGGYRFPLQGLREAVGRVRADATLAALPDPLLGQRLIGNAAERAAVQSALAAVGANPLVVSAFCDRSGGDLDLSEAGAA